MPKIAKFAGWLAFIIAAIAFPAVLQGQVIAALLGLVPAVAGIGIFSRRAWSAYGYAVYLTAQLLIIPVVLARDGVTQALTVGAPSIVAIILLIPIFYFAGKALAGSGRTGIAWPWFAVAALSVLPILFVQSFVIPTASMEPTILLGDSILVQRFPLSIPKRGDLIVFRYPIDPKQTFNKRVIGVGGDRIKLVNKMVFVNGMAIKEPYVIHVQDLLDPYRDNFPSGEPNPVSNKAAQKMMDENVVNGEIVVPAGKFFVLGDNRDNSLDSRYWGFVSERELLGKPLMVYSSVETTLDDADGDKSPLFRQIRWNRLFKMLN